MSPLHVPYSLFPWVLTLKTSPNCLCSHPLWLKPHPLIMKFSIVMALSQRPPVQTRCKSFTVRNEARRLGLTKRNGPPSANQGLCIVKPRSSTAVCTLSCGDCTSTGAVPQLRWTNPCYQRHSLSVSTDITLGYPAVNTSSTKYLLTCYLPSSEGHLTHNYHSFFSPAGHALRTRPADPKITSCFPHLYVSLCIPTYHMHNNYFTHIVVMWPDFSWPWQFMHALCNYYE